MQRTLRYLSAILMILSLGLFLIGCNSSDNDNTPLDDPNPSVNPPSVPTDLRGVVYSSTAIELEWNAATDDGTVVEYQIYRDGSLIARQTTHRFFESALTASTTYTYGVLAVDDEGYFSDTTELDMTTLNDGPVINTANYSVILPYVISIANGDLFDDLRAIVDATDASSLTGVSFDDIAGLTLVDQSNDPTDIWRVYTYDCEHGGSYEYYKDTFIQFGGHVQGLYDACQIGSNILSGNFDRFASLNKGPPYNQLQTSQYNLTVQNDLRGNKRNMIGKLIVDNSQIDNRYHLSNANYFEHNLMWSTTINDIEIDVYATDEQPLANYALPFSRTFDASFRVRAPQTGDESLTVAIEFETTDATELSYQTGSLTVVSIDGSSMHMALDNGDPDAFQLLLSHADSSSALTVLLSDDYRLLCFQTPAFDARLAACE